MERENVCIAQSGCKLIPLPIFTFRGYLRGYRVVYVRIFVSDSLDILDQDAVGIVDLAYGVHR